MFYCVTRVFTIENLEFATRNKKFVPEVATRKKGVEIFYKDNDVSLER